ncbi:hypothetical protein ACH5RR_023555 [Cinchona calisaya]|uniref:Uncharacterized protein n=1 Tax=Cinchona calisaya TaxID=153742 RepID=A0ABD2ZC51_9GENT
MDSSQETIINSPKISHLAEKDEEIFHFPPDLKSSEFDLQKSCTKAKRPRDEKLNGKQSSKSDTPDKGPCSDTFSTECIMKLAKERLFQINSNNSDILSSLAIGFEKQSGLLSEISEELELALLLQAAAEKVAKQQLVDARKLLSMCEHSASKSGSPVQRIVYYFAEALQQRIDQELGLVLPEEREWKIGKSIDEELALLSMTPATVEAQQELPFCLIAQFVTAESILDSVASAKRIHLIDFSIDNGSQWTLLMQALSVRDESSIELLTITAIGTSKQALVESGKWLSSFAETIDLPFSFKIVLSDLKDLKEDLFELEADEVIAVYLAYRLWPQLAWPNRLEALVGVIKNLKPCVMVVRELELSTNTPIFLERFDELLFYLSSVFDCIQACMGHHKLYRKLTEEVYIWDLIRNVITAEGTERYQRHERVSFWRAFLARFGYVETNLSHLSLRQARLLLKRSDRLNSCSLVMDGKSLIMGWKGSPLEFISAWKFQYD